MANGWAREGAVQEQIDSTVDDELQRVRQQLPTGESLSHCEECAEEIPQARRDALRGVRLCVSCQSARDRQQTRTGSYNRRGSKDSQLR